MIGFDRGQRLELSMLSGIRRLRMCSIYVINVGANTNHSSHARSPIFYNNDESFQFVSFYTKDDDENATAYPKEMLPFTNPKKNNLETHNDPDWHNMTYGDICSGPGCVRGSKLRNVVPGDILLFWGLLWSNKCPDWKSCIDMKESCWKDFLRPLDEGKGWYLFGAMRVENVVVDKDTLGRLPPRERPRIEKNAVALDGLSPDERRRIKKNAHFEDNKIPTNHWIFLGDTDKKHSQLFDTAVELWVPKTEQKSESKWEASLLCKTFRTTDDGQCLLLNSSPRWYQYLRLCRKMWDLSDSKERKLAEYVRAAIRKDNKDFDLLASLQFGD